MPRTRMIVVAALIALVSIACGGGDEPTTPSAAGGNATTDDSMNDSMDHEMSVAITSPEDGAQVTVPFTIEIDSSVDLGAVDDGHHHVHIWFDGNDGDYEVVEGDTYEVPSLAPGEHTITVSLRSADHGAVGVEDEITVTVTGGNTEEGSEENDTGYDY